jgi:hypothetical protein
VRAFGEVEALSRAGLLHDRLLAVHVIAVSDADIERLRVAGAAIVWCPTSNVFLFGTTAPRALITSGIDVLLGTDALLTGTGTLLDELHAARALEYIDDETLLSTVGATAARRLGLSPPVLAPRAPADLIALRAPVFDAHPRDVALVLVRGLPALADESLGAVFEMNNVAAEPVVIGGVPKLVAAPLATVAQRVWESDLYGAKRFATSIGMNLENDAQRNEDGVAQHEQQRRADRGSVREHHVAERDHGQSRREQDRVDRREAQ